MIFRNFYPNQHLTKRDLIRVSTILGGLILSSSFACDSGSLDHSHINNCRGVMLQEVKQGKSVEEVAKVLSSQIGGDVLQISEALVLVNPVSVEVTDTNSYSGTFKTNGTIKAPSDCTDPSGS